MEFAHIPVLLEQCLDGLDIKPDGIYLTVPAAVQAIPVR